MDKKHLELLEALKRRKSELVTLESAHSLEEMTKTEPAHGDAMDIADQTTEQEMNMTMRLRSSKEIKLIDNAMEKMHKGIYGICESCEDAIETKRLKARPFVKYCVECQEEMEKSEEDSTSDPSYALGKEE